MDNIAEEAKRRRTTVQDIEYTELFLDREEWRDFFTDGPCRAWIVIQVQDAARVEAAEPIR